MLSSRAFPAHVNFRTPGRSMKNRGENAYMHNTTHKSTKAAKAQTPYHVIVSSPSKKSTTTTQSRPFTDKTPFPNRGLQTPLPGRKKTKVVIEEEPQFEFDLNTPALLKLNDQGATPLPSSTRKHAKLPRSSGKFAPITPMNKGNHWDIIEDMDVKLSEEAEVKTEQAEQNLVEEDEDDWELEYMPPKVEVPYQPPFDFEIPDYKALGSALLTFAPGCVPSSAPPPVMDFKIDPSVDLRLDTATLSRDEPDIDDPFYKPPKSSQTAPSIRKPLTTLTHRRTATTTTLSRPTKLPTPARPRSVTASRPVSPPSKVVMPTSRPGTSIGTRARAQTVARPSSVAATRASKPSALARAPSMRSASQPKPLQKDKDGIVLNLFDVAEGLDDFKFEV